ncbi:hypothetical protein NA57DRAFT_70702 [Rhizodiscina lignyota]|uniref:Uncharacterized protein n=1 Tax=Rhizodiscina lignyota TaxID=1504668 RepID=A0A9P4ISD8_9PEZI|nr:hypothetical protein NA57DRAFT_70702 [Rhizodiscina lignyota]
MADAADEKYVEATLFGDYRDAREGELQDPEQAQESTKPSQQQTRPPPYDLFLAALNRPGVSDNENERDEWISRGGSQSVYDWMVWVEDRDNAGRGWYWYIASEPSSLEPLTGYFNEFAPTATRKRSLHQWRIHQNFGSPADGYPDQVVGMTKIGEFQAPSAGEGLRNLTSTLSRARSPGKNEESVHWVRRVLEELRWIASAKNSHMDPDEVLDAITGLASLWVRSWLESDRKRITKHFEFWEA